MSQHSDWNPSEKKITSIMLGLVNRIDMIEQHINAMLVLAQETGREHSEEERRHLYEDINKIKGATFEELEQMLDIVITEAKSVTRDHIVSVTTN